MEKMEDKYEQVIQLIYELTKEHSETEHEDKFEAYNILDNALVYIHARVMQKI